MNCSDFLSSLEDLALADIDPGHAETLRAHAAACPACAARLADTQALNAQLRGLRETFRLSPYLSQRIQAALAQSTMKEAPGEGTGDRGRGTGERSVHWLRLWRWSPAAVAALFVFAVVALLLAPGGSAPPLIADTVVAYEALSSGAKPLDLSTRDPKALGEHFRKTLNAWVPAPASVGDKPFALKGGCACPEARTGAQIPCAVYERDGVLLALLAVDRTRLDPAVLDRAAKGTFRGRTIYHHTVRGVTVLVCPSGGTTHIWVSRLDPMSLCNAIQSTPEGRLALDGIRIRIEDLTCDMCCSGVRDALAAVPGVKQVAIDMDRGEAQVLPESPELPVSTLVEALTRAGYRASSPDELK